MTDRPTEPGSAAARPDAVSRVSRAREGGGPPDLAELVAQLVRPGSHELVVEGRSLLDGSLLLARRTVPVRALLAELRAELVPGGESGGSGRGGGVALSVDVADVLRDLERLVRVHLRLLKIRPRRDPRECHSCATPLPWCVAGVDPGTGRLRIGTYGSPCCSRCRHRDAPDRIADGLAQLVPAHWPADLPDGLSRGRFTERLAELVDRGRAVLDGETTGTYVRDTRCPVCQVEWVAEPVAGGWDRHPALRLNRGKSAQDGTPGPIRGTTCTACQRRWTWDDMQAPGPPDWQPGKLWQLITADRQVVAEAREAHRRRDAELAERARYADHHRPALGLPRDAPTPRTRPPDRPMPPAPELPVRDDTAAIRAAMTRPRRMDA